MRIATLALIGGLAVAAAPLAASAAPFAPAPTLGSSPYITEIAGGCGPGYHPESWRDAWGYWHRRCVPNYGGGYYGGPRSPYYGGWPEPRWGWRY